MFTEITHGNVAPLWNSDKVAAFGAEVGPSHSRGSTREDTETEPNRSLQRASCDIQGLACRRQADLIVS